MISEGRIVIDLCRNGEVRLSSNRDAQVSDLLAGRGPDEVLDLLPRLFSLCGHAHVAAARRAVRAGASGSDTRADSLLVLAETAREHLLRILTGWNVTATDIDMPAPPVMTLVSDMRRAIGNPAREQRVFAALADYLETCVLGIHPMLFLELGDFEDFTAWLDGAPTRAKAYLHHVIARDWQGLGAVSARFLPDLTGPQLQMAMAEPSFASRPQWQGRPHETGPLARQSGHPLVAPLLERHGAGLLTRLVARLIDLAKIPEQMRQGESPVQGPPGVGIVETARGRLVHVAQLAHGKITNYQILAPTEWNFHPDGVAVRALAELHGAEDLAERATALVEAIDPCVAFEVRAA